MEQMKQTTDTLTLRTNEGTLKITLTLKPAQMPIQYMARDPREVRPDGALALSIVGEMPNSCGQIVDTVQRLAGHMFEFARLCSLWSNYHLNDMNAGTKAQDGALAHAGAPSRYEDRVEALKACGLYEDRGYQYGSKWLYRDLPANVLAIWSDAKAAAEKFNDAREAELAESDDPVADIADERGIDAETLVELADHLGVSLEDAADYHDENYNGDYRTMEEFAEQFAEDIGAIDRNAKWPMNCIDWEQAARELSYDYFMLDCGAVYRNS